MRTYLMDPISYDFLSKFRFKYLEKNEEWSDRIINKLFLRILKWVECSPK